MKVTETTFNSKQPTAPQQSAYLKITMHNYKSEKITSHIYRIIEKTGVCCYLVEGTEKVCLIDTCFGVGNLKNFINQLTSKELFVILTHGHYDHIGGSGYFDDIYMNLKDSDLYKKHSVYSLRMQGLRNEGFHETPLLSPVYSGTIKNISDGYIFDLGNVHIKIISVSGHTQGMMCPLIIEDHTIIFGDACGEGTLLWNEYSSTVSEYKNSLMKLKSLENSYDLILRNHGNFKSDKSLLNNVLECCDLIISGKDDRQCISFAGISLYAAKTINNHEKRIDGKHGNIFYSENKIK